MASKTQPTLFLLRVLITFDTLHPHAPSAAHALQPHVFHALLLPKKDHQKATKVNANGAMPLVTPSTNVPPSKLSSLLLSLLFHLTPTPPLPLTLPVLTLLPLLLPRILRGFFILALHIILLMTSLLSIIGCQYDDPLISATRPQSIDEV